MKASNPKTQIPTPKAGDSHHLDEIRVIRVFRYDLTQLLRTTRWDLGVGIYTLSSRTGRTSMLPSRAGGIFEAAIKASFKSLASIR